MATSSAAIKRSSACVSWHPCATGDDQDAGGVVLASTENDRDSFRVAGGGLVDL